MPYMISTERHCGMGTVDIAYCIYIRRGKKFDRDLNAQHGVGMTMIRDSLLSDMLGMLASGIGS